MELLGPFSDQPELDELAHLMFRQVARFEYALKASGYLQHPTGPAAANWQKFASDIDGDFRQATANDAALNNAISYLVDHRPKQQMAEDGGVVWKDLKSETGCLARDVLTYVFRVRNNLFHGGKFNGRWLDPERSEQLIRNSLTTLSACLELSEKVREAYEH